MQVKSKINLKELYEIDDYLWIQETVKLLKEKKFNELDLENLIEELLETYPVECPYTLDQLLNKHWFPEN